MLGERAAPGCLISVSRKGGDLGTTCQAHIRIQPEVDAPTPVAVTVWTATNAEAPMTTVATQSEGSDAWLASLPVPSPLPSTEWVRADMPDGATIDVGNDFVRHRRLRPPWFAVGMDFYFGVWLLYLPP